MKSNVVTSQNIKNSVTMLLDSTLGTAGSLTVLHRGVNNKFVINVSKVYRRKEIINNVEYL